ncbi:putative Mg2+ transporter-C (MgtC) family protein [Kitasatospora sp. MAA19]|uniref:MgtC/SapB family protein n=1 Tax=Kitasatospora sp. MAA19 TaxID=3035090 RepID=UPI0024764600|nr:MgtC/SapB family protein [Kitasatospora sp. MAA19]MDH6709313.1 putative Mg2+ transporter-C (MgtC) family protein [Kitasatospora sp. MAA19]
MAPVQWASGPSGQGWVQVLEFLLAFLLSGLIGVERQLRHKAAGLRTYTTVGAGAALFTLVSKYGFTDVVHTGTVELDPSRMAAQIVSGLGFIGAGVIFVHRGWVQGLTTAATIWLTAAVGAAAAAGLPLLAALTVAAYFVVSYAIRPLLNRLPALRRAAVSYRIIYRPGQEVLREVLDQCTRAGSAVLELRTLSDVAGELSGEAAEKPVEVALSVQGQGDAGGLTAQIASVAGVLTCIRGRSDEE